MDRKRAFLEQRWCARAAGTAGQAASARSQPLLSGFLPSAGIPERPELCCALSALTGLRCRGREVSVRSCCTTSALQSPWRWQEW